MTHFRTPKIDFLARSSQNRYPMHWGVWFLGILFVSVSFNEILQDEAFAKTKCDIQETCRSKMSICRVGSIHMISDGPQQARFSTPNPNIPRDVFLVPRLCLVPLADLWHLSPDAKGLSALLLYSKLKEAGRLWVWPKMSGSLRRLNAWPFVMTVRSGVCLMATDSAKWYREMPWFVRRPCSSSLQGC